MRGIRNTEEEEEEETGRAGPLLRARCGGGRVRDSPGKQAAHLWSMPTTIDKDNYCRQSSFGFYFPVFRRLAAIIIFVDIK